MPGAAAGPEALSRLLAVWKANTRAYESYVPHPFPGRITLFHPASEVGESESDPTLGWGALTPRSVEIEEIPGDHITMLAEPHAAHLAARLRAWMARSHEGEIGAPLR
jgi:thioesterase domain-containing protein